MKKHFLLFIVLIGLFSGQLSYSKKRSGQKRAEKELISEKEAWAKGLPAARKKLLYKQPLDDEEQMYFDALEKRVKGIAALLAIVVAVFGIDILVQKVQQAFPPQETQVLGVKYRIQFYQDQLQRDKESLAKFQQTKNLLEKAEPKSEEEIRDLERLIEEKLLHIRFAEDVIVKQEALKQALEQAQ